MSIFDRVKNLIVDLTGLDDRVVVPDASFGDDLGFDSLDEIELVMRAEEEFGYLITDEEAEKVVTVADAVRLIESKGI